MIKEAFGEDARKPRNTSKWHGRFVEGRQNSFWCKSIDDINTTAQNVSQIAQSVSQILHKDFKTPFLKCIDHMKKCIKYQDIYFEKM